MAIGVGDILFTSLFTDNIGAFNASFSVVATTAIGNGETITFYAPESGGYAEVTVTLVNGLGVGEFLRVGIPIDGTSAPTLIEAPAGTTVSGITQNGDIFSITGADNVIAGQGGAALAGITNDAGTAWNSNINAGVPTLALDTTAIDAAIALPTDPLPVIDLNENAGAGVDDNYIWQGGAFADIDNPANWVGSNNTGSVTLPDHATGDIGLGTTYASQDAATPCFAPGTLITTEDGEAAVETLKIGDVLRTASGRLAPVKWIGRFTAHKLRSGLGMEPVRFCTGTLGDGLPHSDLIVTANHGMILDGLVINASALVNGDTIDFLPLSMLPTRVVYYHIETENHDVILANGAPSETYVDIPSRTGFDNYQEYLDLYGAERIIPEMDQLRISSRRLVPNAIKARLGIVTVGIEFDLPQTA